jgi:hypothetical protein
MASTTFLNAAFDSVKRDTTKLLVMLPDIPFVDEQAVARSHLNSPQGTQALLDLVRNAVAAGEAADAKEAAKAAKEGT